VSDKPAGTSGKDHKPWTGSGCPTEADHTVGQSIGISSVDEHEFLLRQTSLSRP